MQLTKKKQFRSDISRILNKIECRVLVSHISDKMLENYFVKYINVVLMLINLTEIQNQHCDYKISITQHIK